MTELTIKETQNEDLENLMRLWNDGDVMKYVGFPNGLNVTYEAIQRWHQNNHKSSVSKHFSIYEANLGYCGETFYKIDESNDLATLDIKLMKAARGKGIAMAALSNTLDIIFEAGLCGKAYVDPNPENLKAWALYEKLGFVSKPRPTHLEPFEVYLEISAEEYLKNKAR
jgi:RimJ/RimL family protein N-acetyltransferase